MSRRTRRFFHMVNRNHRLYSLCLPTEVSGPGWVCLGGSVNQQNKTIYPRTVTHLSILTRLIGE